MIITKQYENRAKEWAELWYHGESNLLKEDIKLYKKWEISDDTLAIRYMALFDNVAVYYINECIDNYTNDNHKQLREWFEEQLVEQWYNPSLVSEVDDGWNDYCVYNFYDNTIGLDSQNTDFIEQYKKLLAFNKKKCIETIQNHDIDTQTQKMTE